VVKVQGHISKRFALSKNGGNIVLLFKIRSPVFIAYLYQ